MSIALAALLVIAWGLALAAALKEFGWFPRPTNRTPNDGRRNDPPRPRPKEPPAAAQRRDQGPAA